MKKYLVLIFTTILFLASQISFAQFDRKHSDDGTSQPTNTNTTPNQNQTSTKEDDEKPFIKGFDKSKMIYGGFIFPGYYYGLQIQGSALVGYQFTKRFASGVSCEYFYSSFTGIVYDEYGNLLGNGTQTSRALGLGLWTKYVVLQNFHGLDIYGSIIPEENNYKQNVQFPGYTDLSPGIWYNSLLVGAGVRQRFGRVYMNLAVYYDVLQQNPMYQNIIIPRFGFSFGF